jgi:hypothetical protein
MNLLDEFRHLAEEGRGSNAREAPQPLKKSFALHLRKCGVGKLADRWLLLTLGG